MLHDLVQVRRGKETVMMTDELPKVNDRMKTLRACQRKGIKGQRVRYFIRESVEDTKFKKAPHDITLTPSGKIPRVPKR